MFPFIRLFGPFRHYVIGFVFIALFALQISTLIDPRPPALQTDDPRLADVVSYEDLLHQKAKQVLSRYGATDYSVDLSVSLDHTTITTTTFDPGTGSASTRELMATHQSSDHKNPKPESGETWQEEVSTSPRIRHIKVCIVLGADQKLDHDQLYRSLSYTLGIDLERGDQLWLIQD